MPKVADSSSETLLEQEKARDEALELAFGATIWVLTRLDDKTGLRESLRRRDVPRGLPLYVVIRKISDHIRKERGGEAKSGFDVVKSLRVLDFAHARALDATLGAPESVVAAIGDRTGEGMDALRRAWDAKLHAKVKSTLDRFCAALLEVGRETNRVTGILDEYRRQVVQAAPESPARAWLMHQAQLWEAASNLSSQAFWLARTLPKGATPRSEERMHLDFDPLVGLARREQIHVLNGDALRLHAEFGLTPAEIGEIWNPRRKKGDWKKLGELLLGRAADQQRTPEEKATLARAPVRPRTKKKKPSARRASQKIKKVEG